MYITPKLAFLSEAIRKLSAVGLDLEVPVFKFPDDYPNIRRPDRIVAYVRDLEHARQVAAGMVSAFANDWQADELTFAELLGYGIYTGLDPMSADSSSPVSGRSWRQWLCMRLSAALHEDEGKPCEQRVANAELMIGRAGIDASNFAVPDNYFSIGQGQWLTCG